MIVESELKFLMSSLDSKKITQKVFIRRCRDIVNNMNHVFSVGDKVTVIDIGYYYSHYSKMFDSLGFKLTNVNYMPNNYSELEWEVFNVGRHHMNSELCYAIRSGEHEVLIGGKGIIKI